ncbi:MAG: ABC transporter ATP-binding protein [Pirellulales bacterium]|nr:ABC transporter ATP-binding protein [Pirellulales bacterium]
MIQSSKQDSMGHGPVIDLVGVSKRFRRTLAVDDLTLQVERGTTFGLIGPNGAGKSTTIKMLMGMLRPSGGSVRVLGRDVPREAVSVKQRVGYVPEVPQIYGWMRVGEVIRFCRSTYETWNDTMCEEMVELFQLELRKKVKHLSKGNLAKLSLLLAVVHDPEVLILDEPMAGLDPVAREEFRDGVLRTVCERGHTVFFSTHAMDDIHRLADTVGILYEGRLLVHRDIEQLLSTTKRIRATLADGATPGRVPVGTLWHRVEGREWLVTVEDFSPEKAQQMSAEPGVSHVEVIDLGLEDVFKDFVKGRRAAS